MTEDKPAEQTYSHPDLARRRLVKAGLGLGLPIFVGLPACQLPVPGQRPPPELYRLTPKSTFNPDTPVVDWQLVLEIPLADAGLNTPRISLQRAPTRLEYYARANWADRAPLMVQGLMIQSFENSRKIVSVGRQAVGLRSDFILKSELREFQAEYLDGDIPKIHVAINAKMVKMPKRVIVGSKNFTSLQTAESDNLAAVVRAFDIALGKVMRRLVEWTLATGNEFYK
jgi:cholesterol transport system auxiliary component